LELPRTPGQTSRVRVDGRHPVSGVSLETRLYARNARTFFNDARVARESRDNSRDRRRETAFPCRRATHRAKKLILRLIARAYWQPWSYICRGSRLLRNSRYNSTTKSFSGIMGLWDYTSYGGGRSGLDNTGHSLPCIGHARINTKISPTAAAPISIIIREITTLTSPESATGKNPCVFSD